MNAVWDSVVRPLLEAVGADVVVEIGADRGFTTLKLLTWAQERGAHVHVIDPVPAFDSNELASEFGSTVTFHIKPSLEALTQIAKADAVLLDGDHNWYTVTHELDSLFNLDAPPMVIVHDIDWPYGRRDLYYEPDRIPADQRHPYARRGIAPGCNTLVDGGFNNGLLNAAHEGGPRNGVRTALEDFLGRAEHDCQFVEIPGLHGIGIVAPRERALREPLAEAFTRLRSREFLLAHLEGLERERIESEWRRMQSTSALKAAKRERDAEAEARAGEAEERHDHRRQVAELAGEGAAAVARESQAKAELRRARAGLDAALTQLWEARAARDALARGLHDLEMSATEAERLAAELRALKGKLGAAELSSQRMQLRFADLRREEVDLRAHYAELESALVDERRARSEEGSATQRRIIELEADFKRIAELTDSLARSRSWRLGHGLFVLLRRLMFRRVAGRSAVEQLRERIAAAESGALEPLRAPSARPLALPRAHLGQQEGTDEGLDERTLERLRNAEPPTIAVPIYNAAEDLRRCLHSVIRHTTTPARLMLVDDASTDAAVTKVLDEYRGVPGVTVVVNEANIGFTHTVNRAVRETTGDVVLLNSDTEVGPRWLERLRESAYSADDIGTVTPLSNNAGAFSVPVMGEDNPLPPGLPPVHVSRLVAQTARGILPACPTGNGFCLYVRRDMLDEVGEFDAERFPIGYGEENDLCMRASYAGWRHLVDDRVYVLHKRTASFGERKARLLADGRRALDELHPGYTEAVRGFVNASDMRAVRANVEWTFMQANGLEVRPRALFVVHEGRGGTTSTNLDLMVALQHTYEPFIFTSDGRRLRLSIVRGSSVELLKTWMLDRPWTATRFSDDSYRRAVTEVLSRYAIELVHVRHLFKHYLDLPSIASALDIPVLLSVHDYYMTCPTVHLIDDRGEHCGGTCTDGPGDCSVPSSMLADVPALKHRWVHRWRDAMQLHVLGNVDAMVTTSRYARDLHQKAFPRGPSTFEVIEHGRDLPVPSHWVSRPRRAEPIRVLVPGNLDRHKGGGVVRALHRLDADAGRIELHFLGEVSDEYAALGVSHGPYEREEFAHRVGQIAPHVIAVLSIWPETYCHVLSEAWAAGVPVVAADTGALGERISRHRGGWLVPPGDARAVHRLLLSLAEDRAAYHGIGSRPPAAGIRSVDAMAADYDRLFRRVLARRSTFRSDKATRPSLRRGLLRTTAFVPGLPGDAPGSTYVRTLSRLSHPDVAWRLDAVTPERKQADALSGDEELILVQRTALAPLEVDRLLMHLRKTSAALVVELDDDLLSFARDHEEYGPFVEPLHALLKASALVTVSTPELANRITTLASYIAVVPNMLDERLWAAPLAQRQEDRPSSESLRVLFAGSRTHRDDLALLREVVHKLRDEAGLAIEVEVVGGEPKGPGQNWYSRLDVPPGRAVYPRFVEWMRGHSPRWDVAVAPLVDSPVNRAKSDLKFLEYSALGLPGIYSAGQAYDDCDRDGMALVVENTVEAWAKAVLALASDAATRADMARRAREHVLSERVLARDAATYLDLLVGACERRNGATA